MDAEIRVTAGTAGQHLPETPATRCAVGHIPWSQLLALLVVLLILVSLLVLILKTTWSGVNRMPLAASGAHDTYECK